MDPASEKARLVPRAFVLPHASRSWRDDDATTEPLGRQRRRRVWVWPSLLLLVLLKACLLSSHLSHRRVYVPVLHHALLRQCKDLLVAPNGTYTQRIDRLAAVLRPEPNAGRTLWVAEPSASAAYFIGAFSSDDWWASERPFLLAISVPPGNALPEITLLTPEFERGRAQLIPLPGEVQERVKWVAWREDESPYAVLRAHTGGVGRVVLDGAVRTFVAEGLRGVYGQEAFASGQAAEDGGAVRVQSLRERKDAREVGLLRCANQFTLHAIRKTRSRMHFGITESATRHILEEEMRAVGLNDGDGLVLFGENAALPHGSGTDRRLLKTDFALIDAGGNWGGYVADITRTFALPGSRISREHLEVWETVRRAQYAPYTLLSASNSSAPPSFTQLDSAAREVVRRSLPWELDTDRQLLPLSDNQRAPSEMASPDFSVFTHRLGHGIGLEGHESPYVVQGPQGERPVLGGHVFSLEPGVYVPQAEAAIRGPGQGVGVGMGVGVRLEDCLVIMEDEQGRLSGVWLSGPVGKWGDV